MKKTDAIRHFGNVSKLAAVLGVAHTAVSQWGDDVPARRALELEKITKGALKSGFSVPVIEDDSLPTGI